MQILLQPAPDLFELQPPHFGLHQVDIGRINVVFGALGATVGGRNLAIAMSTKFWVLSAPPASSLSSVSFLPGQTERAFVSLEMRRSEIIQRYL